uniref:Uncharacterized protein n=1 Tax=Lepeophtheirus salmonis TaxID=72036 RepID=A0A0K2SVN2_LEPSM
MSFQFPLIFYYSNHKSYHRQS